MMFIEVLGQLAFSEWTFFQGLSANLRGGSGYRMVGCWCMLSLSVYGYVHIIYINVKKLYAYIYIYICICMSVNT